MGKSRPHRDNPAFHKLSGPAATQSRSAFSTFWPTPRGRFARQAVFDPVEQAVAPFLEAMRNRGPALSDCGKGWPGWGPAVSPSAGHGIGT